MFDRIHHETICPGVFFIGRILIVYSITLREIELLRFLISSCADFGKFYFLRNLSILSKFPSSLTAKLFIRVTYYPFNIFRSLETSFSFLILAIFILSF